MNPRNRLNILRKPIRPILIAVVALSLVTGPSAAVGQGPASAAHRAVSSGPSNATDAQIRAKWTPEMLRSARPADMPVHKNADKPTSNINGSAPQSAQTIWQQKWWAVPSQVGRLYYITKDANGADAVGMCSATAISVDVIVTAGHCVVSVDGTTNPFWHHTFLFVPAQWGPVDFVGGTNLGPWGTWAGERATAWQAYAYYGNSALDYGFVKMLPHPDGKRVGDVVGWFGLYPNLTSYPNGLWNLGYPAQGHFSSWSGNYPWGCYSPYAGYLSHSEGGELAYEIYMGCGSNGGASGGPWVVPYNGVWNYVASVNSQCWASWDSPDGVTPSCKAYYSENLWGPWFDQRTVQLLAYAETLN